MKIQKDISYLGKDFGQFRSNLINFTKQYFPTVYTDFNESDPGTLFLELAAYVGDVLSFYADTNLKESLLTQATERANIFDLANSLGYKPKDVRPAYVDLSVYQVVPSKLSGGKYEPDYNYALRIKPGMRVKQSSGNVVFRTLDVLDFSLESMVSPREVTLYETDSAGNPSYFLLKKTARAVSGQIKTSTFSFTDPKAYDKIVLPDTKIIDIISVVDSNDNLWYEVPYLAQDTIFHDVLNVPETDPDFAQYRSTAPYILKLKYVPKRFVTKRRSDNLIEIQFGAGVSNSNDTEIVPNPFNVGNGLADLRTSGDIDIDPANFLYTNVYGQSPTNTSLTVTYTIGNGVSDNVVSNSLTKIDLIEYSDNINAGLSEATLTFIKNSVSVNNEAPAVGAISAETVDNIKLNAMANFSTQLRAVTLQDYVIRAYSMPAKYGSVSKAYMVPDDQLTQITKERIANPFAMNLYILSYDLNKRLTQSNLAIKENLKTYIDYYRILTDAINIKDAFIINIGVYFEISVLPNYNVNEVLLKCIDVTKQHFDIDMWQINQPILMSDIFTVLANVSGVQSVKTIKLTNLYDADLGYSGNFYDIDAATKNGVIYPSLDPSIFEVKYPNQDIRGRVVNY